MATFTVSGFEVKSEPDNGVSATKAAQLQFVAPLGQATLDFRYVDDGGSSAEISLSNYNILLDGLHLNDGVLPDRIELFNLGWSTDDTAGTSQVFNLAFSEDGHWRDCIFTVGDSPLPDLTNPATAQAILTTAEFSLPEGAETNNIYTLQLDDMPGVEVAGVVQSMFEAEQIAEQEMDHFDFTYNADAEGPDMTEFDIAVRAQEADHLAPSAPQETHIGVEPDLFDPGVDMPCFDDLVG